MRGRTVLLSGAVVLLGAALAFACAGKPIPKAPVVEVPVDAGEPDVAPPPPPLYTRIGAADGVSAIVDSFIDNLLADKRLKKAFAHTTKGPKLDHFKEMLRDQVCELAGGGCHYTGKTMSDAHGSMKITSAQFDAFIEDFKLALEEKQVSKDDEQQLLDLMNVLKDQIVTQK